ncbi:Nif3-like dinuclear metal center hexameric protein [Ulvibacterium sp.]|uniref:Nif3-like dinuclear metal center hexameric protein n=1 Tax=Ulvibacterium sp. TaxID=2665914 RepID=UPI003CC6354A
MKISFHLCILSAFSILFLGQWTSGQMTVTSRELIETIIQRTGAERLSKTVDVIKEGNPETPVRGVVTCMFATMEVLQKAVEKNCNLIITHEPTYYNHLDETELFQKDSVFLEKQKFIKDHNLVIWRFHDYIHRIQPDGIVTGMTEKLGWEENRDTDNPYKFTFPQITLKELLKDIKRTFPENGFHVVGNPEMQLSTVIYVPGASGSNAHIQQLRKAEVDIVVAGEVPQWETYEYVRDANTQGRKKAIVFIGHVYSEASGMKFCADWMRKFVTDIPIHYIDCGSSYWTY